MCRNPWPLVSRAYRKPQIIHYPLVTSGAPIRRIVASGGGFSLWSGTALSGSETALIPALAASHALLCCRASWNPIVPRRKPSRESERHAIALPPHRSRLTPHPILWAALSDAPRRAITFPYKKTDPVRGRFVKHSDEAVVSAFHRNRVKPHALLRQRTTSVR